MTENGKLTGSAVLSGDEIERRLLASEAAGTDEIFKIGTWDLKRLRNAAYDLRIAQDLLILPDGTRYWGDSPSGRKTRSRPFLLKPEQVAFVSSVEEFCMPPDLAGNLAPRFRRALEGLMVIGGMLVDPGYKGRVHFELANIGSEPFEIRPGETSVAGLQLLRVDNPSATERKIFTSGDLLDGLFDPEETNPEPLSPLAFFPRVGKLQRDVRRVEGRLADQVAKLDSTKRSTDQLVVFGMFLLSITLFSVAIAALIEALANGSTSKAAEALGHADTAGGLSHDGLVAVVVLVVVVALFCITAMGGAFYLLGSRRKIDRDLDSPEAAEKDERAAG